MPRRGYRPYPRVLTLGIIKISGFALKGREALADEFCTYLLRKNWRVQLRRATIGPCVRFVITFDLAHPSGRLVPGGRFPGLKPWAEVYSPFGARPFGL